ncbi:PI-PLC X domain-containing protein 1-like isoform X4 [Dunckerocampus dactyliophorus]|uniref:PI-PLC X domain-containing protein 1-like isoform X4 n=1 Tax=Dunckerocampus dactyliophorus TaxID=161453 RepID=UPI002406C562|nr:PI-PLC X domain-containing protein 1-like isoform X4 [Dunckerocampus dactyliophorus]
MCRCGTWPFPSPSRGSSKFWTSSLPVGLGRVCPAGPPRSKLCSVASVTSVFASWICGLPESQKTAAIYSLPMGFIHGLLSSDDAMCQQEALDELATWLDAHPREVVIICCSHFADLTLSDHTQLVEYLISLFGPKLCSSQDNPTLRSCWSTGQQVIVSYENQEMVQCHPELWTGIPYWYADSPDPNKVIAYLEAQKHKGRPAGFYISGLNLTEHAPYILFHPFQSMRKMTTQATTVLLGWVREQRPGPQADSVNIICCDFVDVAQFCDYVIGLNYKGGVDRDKKTGQDLGSSPPVKNADSKRASCRVREAKLRASSIHSSVCPIAVAL